MPSPKRLIPRGISSYKIQKGNLVETFEYDRCGNCIALIDGEGRMTHQSYDGLGRMIQKKLPDGALVTFDYDLDSNLTKVHLPNGNTWQAAYDSVGRKSSEKLLSGSKTASEWEYTYVDGYLIQTKDPMGRIREYAYDCQGRLTRESVDGWQRAYAYDLRGLLLSAEQTHEEHSIVKRSYDADGRLTYESVHLNSKLIQETNQEWEPGQRRLRMGDHERTFVYQNNQLAQVVADKAHLELAYDQSGKLKSKTTPLTSKRLHNNSAGLPEVVQVQLLSDNLQENLEWNPSGRLASYASSSLQKEFTYTPRGYIQSAGVEKYEFDFGSPGIGIRTAATNWQVPHDGLDPFGRVIADTREKFSLTTQYDGMGQVISQGERELEWDPWGRLLKVTDPSLTWEASYDAFGRRLQTRHTPADNSTIITTSFYDPEKEFEEIGVQMGDKTFWKLYGPDSCDAVTDETGTTVYLMQSALKELIALVSEQGFEYTQRTCSSYGPQTEAILPSDLLFYAESLSWHSSRLDPTGLILMGKRYYDPKAGRFISPDPVGYPICMDLYAYAGGDPVNYFDPDGRFASAVYQPVKAAVLNTWNNPRFQGSMQALAGLAEVGVGGAASIASGGAAALISWPIIIHGLDQLATGVSSAITGELRATLTEQLLQTAGMSPEWASLTDCALNIGATMGGAA